MKKLILLIVLSFFALPSFGQRTIYQKVYDSKIIDNTVIINVHTIKYNDSIVWAKVLTADQYNNINRENWNSWSLNVKVEFESSLFPDSILMDLFKNYDWEFLGGKKIQAHTVINKDIRFDNTVLNLFKGFIEEKNIPILPPYLIYEIRKIEVKL
jgi:hypothetical protein